MQSSNRDGVRRADSKLGVCLVGIVLAANGVVMYTVARSVEAVGSHTLFGILTPSGGETLWDTWSSAVAAWSIPWPRLLVEPSLHNPLLWVLSLFLAHLAWRRSPQKPGHESVAGAGIPLIVGLILFPLSLYFVGQSYLALAAQGIPSAGALAYGLGKSSALVLQGALLSLGCYLWIRLRSRDSALPS